jgi:hypothetical protein
MKSGVAAWFSDEAIAWKPEFRFCFDWAKINGLIKKEHGFRERYCDCFHFILSLSPSHYKENWGEANCILHNCPQPTSRFLVHTDVSVFHYGLPAIIY